MAAFTIYFLIAGASSPFIGRLISRYAAKIVISAGAFTAGLGFILLSQMNNQWHYYLGYTVIGAGIASIGHVPSTVVVSNWFEKRRGTAIGIMSTGIGAGGFIMSPIIGGYLIPGFGWRTTYLVLAALIWCLLIPLALLVIKTRPSDIGLQPDGRPDSEVVAEEASSPPTRGLTLRMALAIPAFWLIAVSFLTGGFGQVGSLQSLVPHLTDIGFPAAMAAGALGILGVGSTIGKFGFGWLCDWVPAKYSCAIGLGFQAAGILILMTIAPTSPPTRVWLAALILGLGVGSWLPTLSMLVSTNFGLTAYGTIYGLMNFAQSFGIAAGPLTAGNIFDATGSYYWAFIVFLALYAVSIPSVLLVRRPKSLANGKEG